MNFLFECTHRIRQGAVGELLARAWHVLAPPIPVWKKIYGQQVCLDLRDSPIYWATASAHIENTEGFDKMLAGITGNVWDVGCNVGIFSLYAASQGNKVTAFDISPKAIRLLNKSARRNKLDIATVGRAFAVKSFEYAPPASADVQNRPGKTQGQDLQSSITFKDAEQQFGRPQLIKLDIEGAEIDFLKSDEFKTWVKTNHISLLIELHDKEFWNLLWPDVPHERFDECHVFFNPPRSGSAASMA